LNYNSEIWGYDMNMKMFGLIIKSSFSNDY